MLTGKKVVLGVTGSIAAYKMANVASMLVKLHCDVHVVMTENATKFITPVTFETLTKNPCYVQTFSHATPDQIPHIELGQTADLMLVAPASADILAKMAYGIADNMLTSAIVAATCPVLISPAMNSVMYQNPIVQDNIERLKKFGYSFIEPVEGRLACDAVGIGKLPDEQTLVNAIIAKISEKEETKDTLEKLDMNGINVLITAGPTQEHLDPVRYITNHSSGKMGYAIAANAIKRGANVTLVTGPVQLEAPKYAKVIDIISAQDMYEAVMREFPKQDIVIKAAAVADYRPKDVKQEKMKKKDSDMELPLERTQDILAALGKERKETQCICGFSMETEHLLENSRAKLERKHVDMIAANSIREKGAGFGVDTNHLVLITKQSEEDLGTVPKETCAEQLLNRLLEMWKERNCT